MGYWLVDRRPDSDRWCSAHPDLVDELVLHKMASREIISICILYFMIWPYCVQTRGSAMRDRATRLSVEILQLRYKTSHWKLESRGYRVALFAWSYI